MPTDLTLVSVKYGSSQWLLRNAVLTRQLNPAAEYEWLVVNNDADLEFRRFAQGFTVLPAVNRPASRDRGSAHHAAALNLALDHVKTRFLLILDHDFYVVLPNWMREVTEHMQRRELSFFGSIWHPRWSYQYRDFPSVHFMLIDLERVPLEQLDFAPDIGSDLWDNFISSAYVPIPRDLRVLLQAGRFRDTGWRIQHRFRSSQFEGLKPSFDWAGESARASALHQLAQRFLPQRFGVLPTSEAAVTSQSFLRKLSPVAYSSGWEEFFWRGDPFGFHLRMVGRRDTAGADAKLLDEVISSLNK